MRCTLLTLAIALATAPAAQAAADTVLRNGVVHTVAGGTAEAIAIRDGRIAYVGSDAGAARHMGPDTRVIDLRGRMVMPGLHDGHLHEDFAGAIAARMCDLEFRSLSVADFQARIAACLRDRPGEWLEVASWTGEPAATAATLDAVSTRRPILVYSADGHTSVVNSRALALAGITAATPDPPDGRIERDAGGTPTGVLQDGAQELIYEVMPAPTAEQDREAARAALAALRRQGVTTFMDAMATEPTIRAFRHLQRRGELTARAHFAPVIDVADGQRGVARVQRLRARYDQADATRPSVAVRNAKIILDGVIQAPAHTAGLLEPYVGLGHSGPVYWKAAELNPLVAALARAGIDPHIHAVGDRSARVALDAFEHMRRATGDGARAAIAHAELVDPADYGRFRALDVQPVMSFQWAQRYPPTVELAAPFLGPERFARMEPMGASSGQARAWRSAATGPWTRSTSGSRWRSASRTRSTRARRCRAPTPSER